MLKSLLTKLEISFSGIPLTIYYIFTGCWDEKPSQDSDDCISIHEGEVRDFDFICEDHYGHSDCLYSYNDPYIKPTIVHVKNQLQGDK